MLFWNKFMNKLTFASILMLSTAVFISCSPTINQQSPTYKEKSQFTVPTNPYGAYLAGRVAHIRKDFDKASLYYQIAYNQDKNNPELINKLYLLLTSNGKVDEAVTYAQRAIETNAKNNFAYMVVATSQMKNNQFQESLKTSQKFTDQLYKTLILPIMSAWNYAGINDYKNALAQLNKIKNKEGLSSVYNMQLPLLLDYMGKNREAEEAYKKILNDKNSEISVRLMEIITNFKIRTGQIEAAENILKSTASHPSLKIIITNLLQKLKSQQSIKPILETPAIGFAEALLAIASSFHYDDAIDVAHVYTALSLYLSPNYSTAKILMADIYENRQIYNEANKLYDSIDKNDITYYPAQLKKSRNYIKQKDYKNAEKLLKKLSSEYNDPQIYMDLGDILRITKRYSEAVKNYNKAISQTSNKNTLWVLHYAKGATLEQSGLWKEAEESMLKAYEIKKHYLILNYLGYSWIKQNHNINKAFSMIVEAYNQAPFDPAINDSLGFALYNLGYYTMALPYLERAAEMYPSSAVITSHLGDAYWFAHRKNEAVFQWQHALKLKDENNELNIDEIKEKIKNGLKKEPSLTYDKENIEETIKKIKKLKPFRSL